HLRTWCPPNKPARLGSGSGDLSSDSASAGVRPYLTSPSPSLLPHRIPVAPQLPRQHPLHPLRLRVGQRIELGIQIGPQPQPVLPHVAVVFHAVLVALEPRRGVEPRHPHIQRRLP